MYLYAFGGWSHLASVQTKFPIDTLGEPYFNMYLCECECVTINSTFKKNLTTQKLPNEKKNMYRNGKPMSVAITTHLEVKHLGRIIC